MGMENNQKTNQSAFQKDDQKKILSLVSEHFQYDLLNILPWFHLEHPILEGLTPWQMVERGQTERLLQIVKSLSKVVE